MILGENRQGMDKLKDLTLILQTTKHTLMKWTNQLLLNPSPAQQGLNQARRHVHSTTQARSAPAKRKRGNKTLRTECPLTLFQTLKDQLQK
jgi:hypothetical protein